MRTWAYFLFLSTRDNLAPKDEEEILEKPIYEDLEEDEAVDLLLVQAKSLVVHHVITYPKAKEQEDW